MVLQYTFAMPSEARKYTFLITRKCPTCEACAKPRSLKGPLGTTVIPPKINVSVALDLLNMPQYKHEGEMYDMMAVCVDRHSGWMVAIPTQNKGLTGAKVAKKMIKY